MPVKPEGISAETNENGAERNSPDNLADHFSSRQERAILDSPEIPEELKEEINQKLEGIANGTDRNYGLLCDHIHRADLLSNQDLMRATQACYWKKCRLRGESLAKFYFASGERRDDNVEMADELLIEATREMILPFAVAGLYHSFVNDFRRLFVKKPNPELLRIVATLSSDLINDRDPNDNLRKLLGYLKNKDPRNLSVSVAYHVLEELNRQNPSATVLNYLVDTFTFLFHNGGSFIETVDGGSAKPALVIGGKWSIDSESDPHRSRAMLLKMMDPQDQTRAVNGLGVSRTLLSRSENLTDDDVIAAAAPGLVAMPGMVGLDSEVVNKISRRGSGFSQEQKESLVNHLRGAKGMKPQPVVTDPLRYVDAGDDFDDEISMIREEDSRFAPTEAMRKYGRTYYGDVAKISRLMENINYFDFEVVRELATVDFEDLDTNSVIAVRRLYQDISDMENTSYQKFIDWHDKEGSELVKTGKLLKLSGKKKVRIGESPVNLISYQTENGEEVTAAYTTFVGESFGYFYVNGSQVLDHDLIRRYLELPKVTMNYLREGE